MPAIDHLVSLLSVSESNHDNRFWPKPSAFIELDPSPDRLDPGQSLAGDVDEDTCRMNGVPLMHSGKCTLRAEAFSDSRPSCVSELPFFQRVYIDKCLRKTRFHSRSLLFHRASHRLPTEAAN